MLVNSNKTLTPIGQVKRCTGCGVVKCVSLFYKSKLGKFDRASKCSDCTIKYTREYRKENQAALNAKQRKYYEENRSAVKVMQRKYCKENQDIIKAQKRKYYKENQAALNAKQRKYRKENQAALNAKQRKYRKENQDVIKARQRKYRKENQDVIKVQQRKYCDELHDNYVSYLLKIETKGIDFEITPEMIELKRLQVTLKRLKKEIK